MEKYYLLFSDGTWASTTNKSHIAEIAKQHRFPFPMDLEGDPRRTVTVIGKYKMKMILTEL